MNDDYIVDWIGSNDNDTCLTNISNENENENNEIKPYYF